MLKYLLMENFVKHKHTEINFEKGMTAIVGKNGGGKSLIQEAIRFALFGTAALRGKLENYDKNLHVLLRLSVSGEDLEIDRTLKDCKFGTVFGTTWCNKAIEEKLGFGMNVFDMGCCAKQFEITKLGDMKPTERKQAVDKLIGLDTLELLRKDIKQTLSELRGRRDGLQRYLVEPVEPIKTVEKTSEEIKAELYEGRKAQTQLQTLITLIGDSPKEEPKMSVNEPLKPIGSMESALREKILIEKLQNAPEGRVLTSEEIEEIKASKTWRPFSDYKEPELTWDQIREVEEQWEKYDLWTNTKKIKCPKCEHEFTLSGVEEVMMPLIPKAEVTTARVAWARKSALPTTPKPNRMWSDEEIKNAETLNQQALDRSEMNKELEGIEKTATYDEWVEYKKRLEAYNLEVVVYKNKKAQWDKAESARSQLESAVAEANKYNVGSLESQYTEAVRYETERRSYEIASSHYNDVKAEMEVIEKDLKAYSEADEGILRLKSKIKTYVIPSLQREATKLVSEMTEGELNKVEISDDFDITVNGKELALLSGSEKAVANLAIRLGLGCVLTRKVFNVFMGDEIDESMSEERAAKVAESLHRLLGTIEQIILISHKDIVADNYFSVDKIV